jgi:hypothetical protein
VATYPAFNQGYEEKKKECKEGEGKGAEVDGMRRVG